MNKKKKYCFICGKKLPLDQNSKDRPWITVNGPKGKKVDVCQCHPGVQSLL